MSHEVVALRNQQIRDQIATVIFSFVPRKYEPVIGIPDDFVDYLSGLPEFQTAEFKALYEQWFYAKFEYDEDGFYNKKLQDAYQKAEKQLTEYYLSQEIIQESALYYVSVVENYYRNTQTKSEAKKNPETKDNNSISSQWSWPSLSSVFKPGLLLLGSFKMAESAFTVRGITPSNKGDGKSLGNARENTPSSFSTPAAVPPSEQSLKLDKQPKTEDKKNPYGELKSERELVKTVRDFRKAFLPFYKGKLSSAIKSPHVSEGMMISPVAMEAAHFLRQNDNNIVEAIQNNPALVHRLEEEAAHSASAAMQLALMRSLMREYEDAVLLYAYAWEKMPLLFQGKMAVVILNGFLSAETSILRELLNKLKSVKDTYITVPEEIFLHNNFSRELYREIKKNKNVNPDIEETLRLAEETFAAVKLLSRAERYPENKPENTQKNKETLQAYQYSLIHLGFQLAEAPGVDLKSLDPRNVDAIAQQSIDYFFAAQRGEGEGEGEENLRKAIVLGEWLCRTAPDKGKYHFNLFGFFSDKSYVYSKLSETFGTAGRYIHAYRLNALWSSEQLEEKFPPLMLAKFREICDGSHPEKHAQPSGGFSPNPKSLESRDKRIELKISMAAAANDEETLKLYAYQNYATASDALAELAAKRDQTAVAMAYKIQASLQDPNNPKYLDGFRRKGFQLPPSVTNYRLQGADPLKGYTQEEIMAGAAAGDPIFSFALFQKSKTGDPAYVDKHTIDAQLFLEQAIKQCTPAERKILEEKVATFSEGKHPDAFEVWRSEMRDILAKDIAVIGTELPKTLAELLRDAENPTPQFISAQLVKVIKQHIPQAQAMLDNWDAFNPAYYDVVLRLIETLRDVDRQQYVLLSKEIRSRESLAEMGIQLPPAPPTPEVMKMFERSVQNVDNLDSVAKAYFHQTWAAQGIAVSTLGLIDGHSQGVAGLQKNLPLARLFAKIGLEQAITEINKDKMAKKRDELAPSLLERVLRSNSLYMRVSMWLGKKINVDHDEYFWNIWAGVFIGFASFMSLMQRIFSTLLSRRVVAAAREVVNSAEQERREAEAREKAERHLQKEAEKEQRKKYRENLTVFTAKKEKLSEIEKLNRELVDKKQAEDKKEAADKKEPDDKEDIVELFFANWGIPIKGCRAFVTPEYPFEKASDLAAVLPELLKAFAVLEGLVSQYEKSQQEEQDKKELEQFQAKLKEISKFVEVMNNKINETRNRGEIAGYKTKIAAYRSFCERVMNATAMESGWHAEYAGHRDAIRAATKSTERAVTTRGKYSGENKKYEAYIRSLAELKEIVSLLQHVMDDVSDRWKEIYQKYPNPTEAEIKRLVEFSECGEVLTTACANFIFEVNLPSPTLETLFEKQKVVKDLQVQHLSHYEALQIKPESPPKFSVVNNNNEVKPAAKTKQKSGSTAAAYPARFFRTVDDRRELQVIEIVAERLPKLLCDDKGENSWMHDLARHYQYLRLQLFFSEIYKKRHKFYTGKPFCLDGFGHVAQNMCEGLMHNYFKVDREKLLRCIGIYRDPEIVWAHVPDHVKTCDLYLDLLPMEKEISFPRSTDELMDDFRSRLNDLQRLQLIREQFGSKYAGIYKETFMAACRMTLMVIGEICKRLYQRCPVAQKEIKDNWMQFLHACRMSVRKHEKHNTKLEDIADSLDVDPEITSPFMILDLVEKGCALLKDAISFGEFVAAVKELEKSPLMPKRKL